MANPILSIQPDKARLTVTGKSWDDVSTDSGPGTTIEQITIDDIEDIIDIDLPDIDDDTDIIIGILDPDLIDDFPDDIDEIIIGDIPVEIVDVIPPDPVPDIIDGIPVWIVDDTPVITIDDLPDDLPVLIIDEPEGWEVIALPELDIDDLDLDWEAGLSISDLDTIAYVDADLNIRFDDDLPDEIKIAHMPDKTSYEAGKPIDLEGIMVQAYRHGALWETDRYWKGYVPVHELIVEPDIAIESKGAKVSNAATITHTDSEGKTSTFQIRALQSGVAIYAVTPPDGDHCCVCAAYNNREITSGNIVSVTKDSEEPVVYTTASTSWASVNGQSVRYIPINIQGSGLNTISFYAEDLSSYGGYWRWTASYISSSEVSLVPIERAFTWGTAGRFWRVEQVGMTVIYGDVKWDHVTTISWARPKDGRLLSTLLNITIR